MIQNFEDFLKNVHADDYMGTDDNMPDSFESWLVTLDVQEVIDLAERWGESLIKNQK